MQNAKTKAEKELLKQQHKNDLEKLNKQHEYEKKLLDKELETEKALLKEKNKYTSSGNSGGSSSKKTSTVKKTSSGSSGSVNKTSGSSSGLEIVNSPYSVEGAAAKVASGELNAEQVGNKVYLSTNPDYVKGQSVLDKFTSLLKKK